MFAQILLCLFGLTCHSVFADTKNITNISQKLTPISSSNDRLSTIEKSIAQKDSNSSISSSIHNQISAANNQSRAYIDAPHLKPNTSDPLIGLQQSANPFLTGAPAGGVGNRQDRNNGEIDPRLALILQNSPRLQYLARQNPILAQRILRNPGLLQDPRIAAVIRSQLSGPGGAGLLPGLRSFLPGGALSALNPLGIGLGGAQSQRQAPNNQDRDLGQRPDSRGLDFGAPQGASIPNVPNRPNEENIGGGYYGNNRNYDNSRDNNRDNSGTNNGNTNANTDTDDQNSQDESEGENEDYDGENGQSEGGDGQEGSEQGEQNPAEDPDIQQLQQLGGAGDNFPEGLFPPGLLSKEDLAEIRRQQERQAKQEAERERKQQNDNQGQDYDENQENTEGGDGNEEEDGGEKNDESNDSNESDKAKQEEPIKPNAGYIAQTPTQSPPTYRTANNRKAGSGANTGIRGYARNDFGGQKQSSVPNPGVQYDDISEVTATPNPVLVNDQRRKNPKGSDYVNNKRARLRPGVQSYQANQFINNQRPIGVPYQPSSQPQLPQYQQQPIPNQPLYAPQQYPQYQYPQQYNQQYIPQQQYVPQQQPPQQTPYQPQYPPQPYIPQQQQYIPQQPFQNQPIYQQQYPAQQYSQQGAPVYPPYQTSAAVPTSTPIQNRGQLYTNTPQTQAYAPTIPQQPLQYTTPDPNLINHNLNAVPVDDEETDYNDGAEEDAEEGGPSVSPNSGGSGQSFQQHPRIFSPTYNSPLSLSLTNSSNNSTKLSETISSVNNNRVGRRQQRIY